jgi:hypothetical protein
VTANWNLHGTWGLLHITTAELFVDVTVSLPREMHRNARTGEMMRDDAQERICTLHAYVDTHTHTHNSLCLT